VVPGFWCAGVVRCLTSVPLYVWSWLLASSLVFAYLSVSSFVAPGMFSRVDGSCHSAGSPGDHRFLSSFPLLAAVVFLLVGRGVITGSDCFSLPDLLSVLCYRVSHSMVASCAGAVSLNLSYACLGCSARRRENQALGSGLAKGWQGGQTVFSYFYLGSKSRIVTTQEASENASSISPTIRGRRLK
jgi:hypothetical protein